MRSLPCHVYKCLGGETVVIAAVNGPCDVTLKKQSIEEAVVETFYRPKHGQPGVQDKLTESTLAKICQVALITSLHPRTLVTVVVQEMQDCGGVLACAINAMCLALINSGLPMNFLFAAVCCMIDSKRSIIVDPDHKQLKDSKAIFTLTMEGSGKIISSDITGTYSELEFLAVVERCQAASQRIFQFYREVVKKYADRVAL